MKIRSLNEIKNEIKVAKEGNSQNYSQLKSNDNTYLHCLEGIVSLLKHPLLKKTALLSIRETIKQLEAKMNNPTNPYEGGVFKEKTKNQDHDYLLALKFVLVDETKEKQ